MPTESVPLHVQVSREQRQAKLEQLGYVDYTDYLDGAHWRAVRRRFRESDRTQTCICGKPGVLLHHKTYERLGAEELTDLIALCLNCHEMVHVLLARGEFVNYAAFASLDRANEYVDQNRPMMARARAEAPPTLEERIHAVRRARSKARRQRGRKGKPKRPPAPRPPRPATSHHWNGIADPPK